jgi:hypothetical protein
MTGVLVSMDPSHKEFVDPDGTSIVHVVKGLYGLIETAKLWYDKLSREDASQCRFIQRR